MNIIYLMAISLLLIFIVNKFISIPMPYLLIPISVSIFYNLLIREISFSFDIKLVAQILTGTYIGSTVSKNEVKGLSTTLVPIIISIISMFLGMLLSAWVLVTFFNYDLSTALLSVVPGGVTDITLMSYDFNADISIVSLFQTTRMISILVLFPKLISLVQKDKGKVSNKSNVSKNNSKVISFNKSNILLTLLVGTTFGIIGKYIGIPAGALTVSTIGTITFSLVSNKAQLPIFMRRLAQILSGLLVGSSISSDLLTSLYMYIIPVCITLVLLFSYNILVSKVISKCSSMDRATAMFGSAPGGAGDMVLIASEMNFNVNQPQIILMHVVRLVVVLTLFPSAINLILMLAS